MFIALYNFKKVFPAVLSILSYIYIMSTDPQPTQAFGSQSPPLTVLSLNVRGLKNKIKALNSVIHNYKPDFVFLQETYITDVYQAQRTISNLGLKHAWFSTSPQFTSIAILQICEDWTVTQKHMDTRGKLCWVQIQHKQFPQSRHSLTFMPQLNVPNN